MTTEQKLEGLRKRVVTLLNSGLFEGGGFVSVRRSSFDKLDRYVRKIVSAKKRR